MGRRVSAQRQLRLEPCEARELLAADITGLKLQDLTGNGFSADDTPLAGVTIELFQDNGDGVFNDNVDTLAGTQVTAANGTYTFPAVADGLYFVREVVPAGFFQSAGPAFYTVQVQGNSAFTLNGVGIDDFSEPDPADVYFISALNPDPTLIKHNVSGALGGQRDALIDVIGTSNPLSANVVVGFNGLAGLFSFGSAAPGTSATLQYDGADADVVGPPAALVNNQGLASDLTNGGLATGFLLDFDSIDPGLGTALGIEIRLTSTGGGTATFTDTTTFLESVGPVNHFVPFANFTTAGGFTFSNVTSVEIVFNGAGVQDVDFEVDQILTAGQQANFGNTALSSLAGFVYVDADNDGVFDAGEAPIPNTTVTLTGTDDLGNAVNTVVQTDANGAYLFDNLRPGTYTITETQPAGFLDGKDTIGTPGGTTGNDVFSNIVLPTDFDGVNNNFGEILASSLAGFVYVDADNDGVFDVGEAPIPNTTITLTGTDDLGNAVNLVDTTDASGAYLFDNLRPGTYTITETQPAGFLDGKDTIGTPGGTTGKDVFSNIVLPTDFDGVNNNFGEILASSIGGFVYSDADNDGVFDAGEAPIPNVTVTLTGTDDLGNAVNLVDTTDAAGAYLFDNLRPGTYTITETQPAGFLDGKDTIGTPGGTTGNDVFSNIVLPTDFDGVNNNFGELLPASLSGFVYIDEEDDGQRTNNPGIPNVTVTLTGTDDLGAAVNTVVQTDANGFYQFTSLRPGTYTITETQPAGFADGKDTIGTPGGTTGNDVFSNIVLVAGFNGTENNFGELEAIPSDNSSISGFVYVDVNDNGVKEPQEFTIGNVIVRLTGTDVQGNPIARETTTAVTGFYIFDNLPAGTYTIVEVQPNGFLDGKDTIGTPGGTTGNDIFSNIVLPANFDGVNNNFGERGLINPPKSLLLASTPVPPNLANLGVVIGAPAGAVNNAGLVAQAASGGGAGTNAGWLDAVYDEVLGRDPSSFEANRAAAELSTGQASHRDVAEDLLESRERKAEIITDLYNDYLGRAPDAAGMEFWLGIWDRFNGPERVQSGIIGSPEYYQTAGGTDQAWVGAMYQNILGRTAGPSEINYHVNRLHQPGVNLQTIVLGFVYSDEYRSDMISDWYFDYLARAPEQGGVQYWLNQMKNGQSQESIQAGLLGSLEYRNQH